MAETLPCVMAKEIMSNLLSFASDQQTLAWGFKDELKRLQETAEMVQALLFDASANNKTQLDGSVGIWLKKLHTVAYDADAVLEEFNYETLRWKLEINGKMANPILFRLKMAHKITSINKSLDEIYKEGTQIGLIRLEGVKDATIQLSEIRPTHPNIDDSFVVGMDAEVSYILKLLFSSENERHLSSMAIVGMGGVGKTTLARLVCKHDKVVRHFDEMIWITVIEDFDVTKLLNEMVQSLTGKNPQLSNVHEIVKNELRGRLKGKRYLLVLDDVWNEDEDKWDCLRKALLGIGTSHGNKIMVTTRSQTVASIMQTSLIYEMSVLSLDVSWAMFEHRAFAEGGAMKTENMEYIGLHPNIDDSFVVGMGAEVSEILEMLFSSENERHLSFMAIVGMGGQGKTTLARLVFNCDDVKRHFDEMIWITVSEDFDLTKLLNEMVQSLTGKNPQLSNVREIVKNELRGRLKGKRYLLVLDDVWNEDEDKWDCLRKALLGIGTSRGSKIMVTTRSQRVASITPYFNIFHLQFLTEEHSWYMFTQRAFAEGGAMATQNMVDISKYIVQRCKGLPLAIKALGGLMYSKKSETEWRSIVSILRSRLSYLDETSQVLKYLEICYEHLPSPLKHCFAFCSIFPKDFDLEKSNLIQLWMALGLLRPPKNSDSSMEYIGNKYFDILFLYSMLQDANKDEYNSITSCKMHDLFHDLAQYKSDNYCSNLEASHLNGDSDVVHLSLISSLREIPEISMKICSRLQTLILKGGLNGKFLASLKCLRVLVLENYSITELPASIEMLKYLRYLDISKTSIFLLPDNITKLYNLQTLKLRWVHEVPKSFGHLINLRHFCFGSIVESQDCMFIGVGQLTNLQTLPFFTVNQDRGCHIEELGSLDNLSGDLTIFGLEHVENYGEAKYANLSKKSHLHTLRFCWATPRRAMQFRNDERINNKVCNDEDVLEGLEPHSNLRGLTIENFVGGKFPSWMMVESQPSSVLCNLVKIRLCNCNGCERIPPLGHLQYLKVVKIIGMGNVKVIGAKFYGKHAAGGGASSSSSGAAEVSMFPALRELTLKQMPRLEKWLEAVQRSGSMSVFPCLEKLKIRMCSSLKTMPSHFPSLRELIISGCNGFSYFPNNLRSSIFDLSISGCPNLSCLPNNLQALVKLHLEDCDSLTDISCLPSVREVSISGCTKLIGLPGLTQVFPLRHRNFILEVVIS